MSLYRPVAEEIFCAVDARLTDSELRPLRRVADRIVRIEMGPNLLTERYRPWMLQFEVPTRWVMLIDSDEVPSASLIEAIPSALAKDHILAYVLTRRWLFRTSSQYIGEYPWDPDWNVCLVRSDPATLTLSGQMHEGILPVEPFRYMDLATYHLDCIISSEEDRTRKVRFYEAIPSKNLEDGRSINQTYYLPERQGPLRLLDVPATDRSGIDLAMEAHAAGGRVLTRADEPASALNPDAIAETEIARWWPGEPLSDDAYKAHIELLQWGRGPRRPIDTFANSETRNLFVRLTNLGSTVWRRSGLHPRFFLSSRWFPHDGGEVVEGPRLVLHSDVRPGEEILQPLVLIAPAIGGRYQLCIDLVHEPIRWFSAQLELAVTVREE
jgi:hypothetical protein